MDHDRLFKELLGTFFPDFLRLFVPELAERIQEASLVPLDKEIFTDVTAGERHEVDLLVRARLKEHSSFFLIHVETQASAHVDFAKRMFRYFARLALRHDAPIYPIALLTYDAPRRAEPDTYELAIAELEVLRFRFRAIQLNRLSWRDFKETKNPVASALMAKMGIEPEERARVKWECYRLLATLRLDPAKTQLVGGFVNAYLGLSAKQEREFRQRVAQASPAERKAVMELTTPWHEAGRQEGRQEGRQVGRQEGLQEGRQVEAANLVVRLLAKRLQGLSPAHEEAVRRLPVESLESLAEAVFEITTEADLSPWLA